jgi:Protein of unknown function (DUF3617)
LSVVLVATLASPVMATSLPLSLGLVGLLGIGWHLPVLGQAPPRRDGNWEVTVEILTAEAGPHVKPRTITQCVTPEDAADPKKSLMKGNDLPAGCVASDHKVDDKKVSWTFKCEGPPPLTGTGEIEYTDETSYTGTLTLTRESRTMTVKYTGKRLGDCTK